MLNMDDPCCGVRSERRVCYQRANDGLRLDIAHRVTARLPTPRTHRGRRHGDAGTDDHISVCRAAASERIGTTTSASTSSGEENVMARRYRPSPSSTPRGSASSAPL